MLLTNDDGIDSWFLEVLVNALLPHYEVAVAAPAHEMSWIGRAISRQGSVKVVKESRYPCQAWRISGTPTDCVNIAIGNLLPRRPSAVLSGINIGYNVTVPLILSSGTVAGAIEGTLHHIPSAAFSKQIPHKHFEEIKAQQGRSPKALLESVEHCARWVQKFIPNLLSPHFTPEYHLHNINFPYPTQADTPTVQTQPVLTPMPELFASDNEIDYQFRFPTIPVAPQASLDQTDWECLNHGNISHSLLNLKF